MNSKLSHIAKEHIVTIEGMEKIAQDLYSLKNNCSIYTFDGPLGAGKTTLVRLLLAHWGIQAVVTSPTFSYVNIYQTAHNELLYHFDLYRLSSLDEFIQSGFDEFLYLDNTWVFIEWPSIVQPLLKEKVCGVQLTHADKNMREVTYCCGYK